MLPHPLRLLLAASVVSREEKTKWASSSPSSIAKAAAFFTLWMGFHWRNARGIVFFWKMFSVSLYLFNSFSLSSRLLGQRPYHFYVPKWLQYFIFLVEFSQLSNNIDATKMAKVLPSSTLSLYLFLWHCNSSKIILVSTNKFLFLSEWLANLAKCVMLMLINKHRRCQERLRRFCCRFNFNRIHGFEFESWGRILD